MVKWLRFASNSRDAQSVKLTLNSVTFEDVPSQPQCTKKSYIYVFKTQATHSENEHTSERLLNSLLEAVYTETDAQNGYLLAGFIVI